MKRIFYIYHKLLKLKKRKYFFQYYIKALKISNIERKTKENIHNKLFNDSKKRQELMRELEHKIYQSEEEICTFSPKINNNAIKYNDAFKGKFDELFGNDSLFNKIINNNSSANINKTKNNNNNFSLNKTKSVKILKNYTNINQSYPLFNYTNEILNKKGNVQKDKNRNSHNNKLNISNKIKDDENFNLVFNSYNYGNNYKNDFQIFHNKDKGILSNKENIDLNNILYNKSSKILNNNKKNNESFINNLNIINNKDKGNENFKNFIDLNKSQKRNKTFVKDKNLGLKKEKSYYKDKKYFNINIIGSNNVLKRNKSNLFMSETDYQSKKYNQSDVNQNEMDYLKIRYIENQKKKNFIKKKFQKDIFNDIMNNNINDEKKINKKGEKRNLQKNNSIFSDFINPINVNNDNENKGLGMNQLKQEMDKHKKISLSKRNKSFSSTNINKNKKKSFSSINNSFSKKARIINNKITTNINKGDEENINKYFKDNLKNKNIDKIEYFYTFRNKKDPYSSLSYLYNSNLMANTSKNNIRIKSNNDLSNNIKNSFRKNNTVISIIEKQNKKDKINKLYKISNMINDIYLNNYDKKNCILNKMDNYLNRNNNKPPIYNVIGLGKSRPSINTNNTNNDTKGYSSSTLSAKEMQFIKTNSKRGSKGNNNTKNKNDIIIQDNENNNYSNKNKRIIKSNEIKSKNISDNKDNRRLKVDSKVQNEYFNGVRRSNGDNSNGKYERSLTLQSISDSKMLEIAEHYIDTKDDCLDDIGIKKIIYKKPLKKQN